MEGTGAGVLRLAFRADRADPDPKEKFLGARSPPQVQGSDVEIEPADPVRRLQVVLLGDRVEARPPPFILEEAPGVDHLVLAKHRRHTAIVIDVVAVDQKGTHGPVHPPCPRLGGAAEGGAGGIFPEALYPLGHGDIGAAQRDFPGRSDSHRGLNRHAVVVTNDRFTRDFGKHRDGP